MPRPQRVLVTGGAGFIGSHVADHFRLRDYDVVIVDNLTNGHLQNVGGSTLVEMDIATPDFVSFLRSEEFDLVCHLAAQIDVRNSLSNPSFDATTNILGTLNLLEGTRLAGSRARIIFGSTGGALYGARAQVPTSETWAKEPESPYGISKLAAEHYLNLYTRIRQIDSVVLRFGNVYGPRQLGQGEAGVVGIFCNRLLAGDRLTIFGDGEQTRDYVYVADIARAVFQASLLALPNGEDLDCRAFNIATGIGTSVRALAQMLMLVSGIDVPLEFEQGRPGEVRQSILLPQKAIDSGLLPTVTRLPQGLEKTFEWFQSRHQLSTTN
jgi:UDP-glucose 4-epimerase